MKVRFTCLNNRFVITLLVKWIEVGIEGFRLVTVKEAQEKTLVAVEVSNGTWVSYRYLIRRKNGLANDKNRNCGSGRNHCYSVSVHFGLDSRSEHCREYWRTGKFYKQSATFASTYLFPLKEIRNSAGKWNLRGMGHTTCPYYHSVLPFQLYQLWAKWNTRWKAELKAVRTVYVQVRPFSGLSSTIVHKMLF